MAKYLLIVTSKIRQYKPWYSIKSVLTHMLPADYNRQEGVGL
jgi:hypothetical protein